MTVTLSRANTVAVRAEAMLGWQRAAADPPCCDACYPVAGARQMLMTADAAPARDAYRLGMVNEIHEPRRLMSRAQPIEHAIAIMMDAHWRSAAHPAGVEGVGTFNDGPRTPFNDSGF